MACASCNGVGHFSAFVPGTDRQYIKTTGQTIGAPNDTAGMHARMSGVRGLGGMDTIFNFSPLPTDWISGIPNGYVVVAGAAILVLAMMR